MITRAQELREVTCEALRHKLTPVDDVTHTAIVTACTEAAKKGEQGIVWKDGEISPTVQRILQMEGLMVVYSFSQNIYLVSWFSREL